MDCLSPRCISGAMCGNLFIVFSMFTLGLRNLALTILQLFPNSTIAGLFSDPSMTLLLFRPLCKKPLSWMNIIISHVCFKICAHMATSWITFSEAALKSVTLSLRKAWNYGGGSTAICGLYRYVPLWRVILGYLKDSNATAHSVDTGISIITISL